MPPESRDHQPVHPKKRNLRAQVILLLAQVLQGESLSSLLANALNQVSERDRSLFNELVNGTLRHWFALELIIQPLLSKPLKDKVVQAALSLGAYQLLQMRIPAHAAISETVEGVKQSGKASASGLVNAILRRLLRELEADTGHDMTARFQGHHGLPEWLASRLQRDWPEQFAQMAQVLRQTAPLFLRVNTRQRSRSGYLESLTQADIEATEARTPDGIWVKQSVRITDLPGFAAGHFSVQDENAQRCAALLGDLNQKTVIDACAAPGGKTAHLLEKNDLLQLLALDHDDRRLQRIRDNLTRLQLLGDVVQIKGVDASRWQPSQPVDAILLDAPCTATGVLRRHPDIRVLRNAADIGQTVSLQARLLNHLWKQLKPGGQLLYVTCSLLKIENELQMQNFLKQHADAQEIPLSGGWGEARSIGRQCFPAEQGGDGFYFALLQKAVPQI